MNGRKSDSRMESDLRVEKMRREVRPTFSMVLG